jgi:hypothetical protein
MEGERTVSVMLTTENNRDELRKQIKEVERRQVGEHSELLPLEFDFWGVKVYTLPESAFEEFETDDGESCDCLMLPGNKVSELIPYWENLQAGKIKLRDIPIEWKEPEKPVYDFLTHKENLPWLKDTLRLPKYLPVEPTPPPPLDHLKRLFSRPNMSREEIEHLAAHRKVEGGKLCIVLLSIALKKLKEEVLPLCQ